MTPASAVLARTSQSRCLTERLLHRILSTLHLSHSNVVPGLRQWGIILGSPYPRNTSAAWLLALRRSSGCYTRDTRCPAVWGCGAQSRRRVAYTRRNASRCAVGWRTFGRNIRLLGLMDSMSESAGRLRCLGRPTTQILRLKPTPP